MALYTLPNATDGIDNIVVETVAAVPGFTPLLLTFIFFLIFLGGISRQKARSGTADYAMWSVVASLTTFMTALIMSTITGIIRLDWLIITLVVAIFSGVWLFFDRKPSEL